MSLAFTLLRLLTAHRSIGAIFWMSAQSFCFEAVQKALKLFFVFADIRAEGLTATLKEDGEANSPAGL